ncbi:hypothetical protein QOT17_017471 [Balamuthia mandrillaris]
MALETYQEGQSAEERKKREQDEMLKRVCGWCSARPTTKKSTTRTWSPSGNNHDSRLASLFHRPASSSSHQTQRYATSRAQLLKHSGLNASMRKSSRSYARFIALEREEKEQPKEEAKEEEQKEGRTIKRWTLKEGARRRTTKHNDLSSFLAAVQQREEEEHKKKTDMEEEGEADEEEGAKESDYRKTAYYSGTEYEYQVLEFFNNKYNFRIERCGGAYDAGIDFQGQWLLPKGRTVSIIGQCKKTSKKLGAKHLREFEGTLSRCEAGTLGMLVSYSGFSNAAKTYFLERNKNIHLPMIIASINNRNETESFLSDFVLNASAQAILPSLVLAKRYLPTNTESGEKKKGVVLLYNGEEVQTAEDEATEETTTATIHGGEEQ